VNKNVISNPLQGFAWRGIPTGVRKKDLGIKSFGEFMCDLDVLGKNSRALRG
jgi:hypothetical protein